jgi:N-acetylglucosaminyl-diphospho-decaprenol L-rhamnosyltransferase
MNAVDLSVVVVTHNGRRRALETLHSARASTGEIECEWLVVDNGSTDGTPEALEAELPDVRLFRQGNIGFAAGNNVALEHARGRYVLLLNPDVVVLRGTFADLLRELDSRPEVGVASVVQRGVDGTLQPSARRFPTPARQLGEALLTGRWAGEAILDAASYDSEMRADWLVGAFLAVRREALERVGPLDERFFLYSEEKDWCMRIGQAGYEVMHLPTMEVTHHTGDYERPSLAAQLAWSKLLFARKHFGRGRRLAIHGALALGYGLRTAALGAASAVRPRFRRRFAAERAALAVTLGLAPPPFGR